MQSFFHKQYINSFFLPFLDYVNDNVKYYTTFKLGDINGNF